MKGLFTLVRQEILVALRSGFLIFLAGIFVVLVVVYHLLPDSVEIGPSVVVLGGDELSGELEIDEDAEIVSSREELEEAVAGGSVGIVADASGDVLRFELVVGPGLSERSVALVESGLRYAIAQQLPGALDGLEIEYLTAPRPALTIPQIYVPMIAMFEVAILGFMFVAVMVFQERQDGAIRAYRVSPSGTARYVVAKVLTWTLLGVIYGAVFVFATLLFSMTPAAWLTFLALLVLVNVFMTAVGLIVASFFRSISEWFFVGLVLLVINMVPQVSFANPSFSPEWIKAIPSYPALFAMRDIFYGSAPAAGLGGGVGGDAAAEATAGWALGSGVSETLLLYLALAAAATLVALPVIHYRLMKNTKV